MDEESGQTTEKEVIGAIGRPISQE